MLGGSLRAIRGCLQGEPGVSGNGTESLRVCFLKLTFFLCCYVVFSLQLDSSVICMGKYQNILGMYCSDNRTI